MSSAMVGHEGVLLRSPLLQKAGLNLHETKLKEENNLESLAPIRCSKRRIAMSVQAPRSTSPRSARSTQETYDGYQSYCTICCEGKELLQCSNAVPRLPAAPRRRTVTVS